MVSYFSVDQSVRMTDRQSDSVIPRAVLHVWEKKEMDGGIKKGGRTYCTFPPTLFLLVGRMTKRESVVQIETMGIILA